MPDITITRRVAFVIGAAASATSAPGQTASQSVARVWAETSALTDRVNAQTFSDDDLETVCTHLFALETFVLRGPIKSRADALAKLRCAGLTFDRGARTDHAEGPAFDRALDWLETN